MFSSGLTLEYSSASEKEYKVKKLTITLSSCKDDSSPCLEISVLRNGKDNIY